MNTSWDTSSQWYENIVGYTGHYYHEHLIIPRLLPLLQLHPQSSILDIGAGQGILARYLPKNVTYLGIDNSSMLINQAKKHNHAQNHTYLLADITQQLPIDKYNFTHAVFLLSIQNIEHADKAIRTVAKHLIKDGILIIVMNHPCFRIPRQSGWGFHEDNKLQYRYINRYLSDLKIPIQTHPGMKNSPITWSFHHSLGTYISYLSQEHLFISELSEWESNKKSIGTEAKKENRARSEIPLFLMIKAVKC